MKSKKNLSVNVDSLSELGNTISETVYNCLNQPLTVTDAMGKATTYTYNALGKVESVTDSLNHRTEFTYNSRGQNTEVRDATNNVSSATYDLLGNVTRLAGPLGGATNYTYDDMGRLTSESTVSGGTKSYEYNELNVRKKITNARGQLRQIFYDSMGRITGYTSPEGSVSYTYDANGNVLTVVDSHGTITRTYDALNRVSSYTDTYGKVIRYEYDAVGNLSRVIYPDNTAVTYAYDANHNLVRVTDWANRVTSYTYDANNRVVGVTKPDGSMTNTVYDNKQRVTSTVERTAGGVVITGFEYTYDDMSRIIEEKILANSTKMCYTYDSLNRVTARTVKNATTNEVISTETFTYDTAGNITDAPDSCFSYDTNNRLIVFNGNSVSYDLDGNMLDNGEQEFTYDSANKLVTADGHTYTYNAEDVRIRNFCTETDTSYTYDTNARLSKLLMKTTNGVTTKYVYGRGLIGEELNNAFKTYHFDCRGSTIAITDISGNITDTFVYDTYGKLLSRTGTSFVIFGYNGRDGVVTDANGLIYMRARYYSPAMKRFVNADIVAGQLSNAITLNRFAYANGNPVSFVDPFGLSVWSWLNDKYNDAKDWVSDTANDVKDWAVDTTNNVKDWAVDTYNDAKDAVVETYNEVKDWTVDTYNNVKDRVVSTTNNVVSWVDNKVVKPVTKAATAVGDWFEEAGEWLNENARNKDGSYALYDNQRFKKSVFHEQILAFTPSGPSFNIKEGNIGLGSLAVDGITGGWEGEHANLSLLDFGHAEVSAEMKDGQVSIGALASIWSPSFSITFFGVTLEIGAEVGAIGAGGELGLHGVKGKFASGLGVSIGLSW